ncbi:MAG: ABC transporter permease [Phycisphaerae bacterium]|nr:ABC transporter permease [Phycisphaerae bacterium]
MTTLWQDLRYAVRMLKKSPGFTAIALITLAIGIGANTIMFSVVNVLLLRPPQVKDPDQLVLCNLRNVRGYLRYSAYVEMRDDNQAFSDLIACDPEFGSFIFGQGDAVRRIFPMFVSANYFSALGVAPAYGRTFEPEEERSGTEPVVVLGYRTWQREGADPALVGKYVGINGTLFRVIGVAPKRFTGASLIGPDLWLPLGSFGLIGRLWEEKRPGRPSEWWDYPNEAMLIGRLKPGLTMSDAQLRLQSLSPRLKEINPRWWGDSSSFSVERLPRLMQDSGGGNRERIFLSCATLLLMGVSAVVLLIACLNVGNMTIVRGAGRHREIAIRMAIGGGRWQIIRQLLIESFLLATLGGVVGLVFAFWGVRTLSVWLGTLKGPVDVAGSLALGLDLRVLAATLGFCMVAAMLSGLKPALRLSRREVAADLKESRGEMRRSTGRVGRPRRVSVICQIALSVVLVMEAALFTRSALQTSLSNFDFSFDGKLLIQLDPLAAGYDLAGSRQVYETLADRLKSMPGVHAVGLSSSLPVTMDRGGIAGAVREYVSDAPKDQRDEEQVLREAIAHIPGQSDRSYTIGMGGFEAMGIPLLQGRSFDRLDSAPGAEKVVIVDERIARRLRPDGRALGCLVQYGWPLSSSPCRVVGIVPHLQALQDDGESRGQIYEPIWPNRLPDYVYVRLTDATRGAEAALLQRIPAEIRAMDPRLPILSVATLSDSYRNQPFVWATGMGARLAAIFGALALFLASLGIYAVKGYMVASRTSEIGIRKALGATHGNIMVMVLREGMVLTLAGLFVGLLLGLATARLIGSLLYGVSPIDPVSIVVTVVLLGAASLLASYIPARRAARVDPMVALRCE